MKNNGKNKNNVDVLHIHGKKFPYAIGQEYTDIDSLSAPISEIEFIVCKKQDGKLDCDRHVLNPGNRSHNNFNQNVKKNIPINNCNYPVELFFDPNNEGIYKLGALNPRTFQYLDAVDSPTSEFVGNDNEFFDSPTSEFIYTKMRGGEDPDSNIDDSDEDDHQEKKKRHQIWQ